MAPAERPSEPAAATGWESRWLIERPVEGRAHPEYWGGSGWTDDPWKAQAFNSQEDGERRRRADLHPFIPTVVTAKVVSHGFEVEEPLTPSQPQEARSAAKGRDDSATPSPGSTIARSVSVTVYGVPQPAGSKVAGRSKAGKLFVRDAAKGSAPWKRQVAQAAGEAMGGGELLEGPLLLRADFYVTRPAGHFGKRGLLPSAPAYPAKRPDLTKLLRAVEDGLTGIVWRDDAQVVVQTAMKLFGEPARCELYVASA